MPPYIPGPTVSLYGSKPSSSERGQDRESESGDSRLCFEAATPDVGGAMRAPAIRLDSPVSPGIPYCSAMPGAYGSWTMRTPSSLLCSPPAKLEAIATTNEDAQQHATKRALDDAGNRAADARSGADRGMRDARGCDGVLVKPPRPSVGIVAVDVADNLRPKHAPRS